MYISSKGGLSGEKGVKVGREGYIRKRWEGKEGKKRKTEDIYNRLKKKGRKKRRGEKEKGEGRGRGKVLR